MTEAGRVNNPEIRTAQNFILPPFRDVNLDFKQAIHKYGHTSVGRNSFGHILVHSSGRNITASFLQNCVNNYPAVVVLTSVDTGRGFEATEGEFILFPVSDTLTQVQFLPGTGNIYHNNLPKDSKREYFRNVLSQEREGILLLSSFQQMRRAVEGRMGQVRMEIRDVKNDMIKLFDKELIERKKKRKESLEKALKRIEGIQYNQDYAKMYANDKAGTLYKNSEQVINSPHFQRLAQSTPPLISERAIDNYTYFKWLLDHEIVMGTEVGK